MTADNNMMKRLLDVKEASAYCGVSRGMVREWCREIGAERRIGRRVLYDRMAIDAEIDRIGRGEGTAAVYIFSPKKKAAEIGGDEE